MNKVAPNLMTVAQSREYVVSELKRLGFHLLGYQSMTTASTYIKIDYGVGNSIRISDHRGKKNLKYRYNVATETKRKYPWVVQDRYQRHYFPATKDNLDIMIGMIAGIRDQRIRKYGKENYERFCREAYENNKHNRGFWQRARIL